MPTTMQLISAQTLTSASASVTFSSIPATFTDLKILMSTRNSTGAVGLWIRLNGDSAQSYSWKMIYGSGSTAASISQSVGTDYDRSFFAYADPSTYTANTFSNLEMYIPNYLSSNAKSVSIDSVGENNSTTAYSSLTAGLWSTSAITSITILPEGATANLVAGSSFYLYGISSDTANQNTSGPYAFGGDTITTDGTYWYHAFLGSNSFTPQKNLTADVLVVAGGGGGAGGVGGGGGAGGYQKFTSQSLLSNTPYSVTIGAGGVGGSGSGVTGITKGSNSVFGSLTASSGGGYGGSINATANATSGGSGGGGAGAYTKGTGTAGQGNNGADGGNAGGGGGGAGGAGTSASSINGGAGGAGTNTDSSWATATNTGVSGYYAGGGGGGGNAGGTGGAAGSGGATAGTQTGNASNATANTGSGGGGGAYNGSAFAGGNGGSGIIILRYAV